MSSNYTSPLFLDLSFEEMCEDRPFPCLKKMPSVDKNISRPFRRGIKLEAFVNMCQDHEDYSKMLKVGKYISKEECLEVPKFLDDEISYVKLPRFFTEGYKPRSNLCQHSMKKKHNIEEGKYKPSLYSLKHNCQGICNCKPLKLA